ncbi:nickel pincer cofactor biosynthesis protein LarC [Granulicella sp. L46]|uniref:nickel pincer cofactor biosynthesis protein LarC n=1 Tax=Granulicella sp. L46 TaxID=1641865 RepID=UPI00131C88AF|nr:nickel pincer cofactor biosynthesis protein LarC [Granulicella sp. L46]
MRIAYLECFAGIAGDMFLGALIDAGVPAGVLQEATAALELGASLKIETVDRSGISCTRVQVMEGASVAEERVPEVVHDHARAGDHTHSHTHEHEHTHEHKHEHSHGRSLSAIRELIRKAPLAEAVKGRAIRTFCLLGASEAKIHNVDVEKIHFHEVGAVDAIVDIVAACAGIEYLKVDAWYCSPLNVGGGMVKCAHGTFPVPAPATADLLRGFPTYSAHVQKELVTPTGAALVRMLEPVFGAQPAMSVERIGYGAGSRNPKGFPNALRISIGEAEENTKTDTVTVLETALDDLSPQVLAWVAESALAAGAMDVMLTPVIMKKGRPGTLLTVLCSDKTQQKLERLILRETSTLGMRIRRDERSCLERHHLAVQTPYGEIRVKIGKLDGEVMNAAPEFEDCRAAAVRCDIPLKQVQQAAIAAYAQTATEGAKVGGKVAS